MTIIMSVVLGFVGLAFVGLAMVIGANIFDRREARKLGPYTFSPVGITRRHQIRKCGYTIVILTVVSFAILFLIH